MDKPSKMKEYIKDSLLEADKANGNNFFKMCIVLAENERLNQNNK